MSSDALGTALLLLAFNRPDTTARVFEAIRRVRPKRLYVAVDGPRPSRVGEPELCAAVRKVVTSVDWPCTLSTLFRETNLGSKRGVSSAIDWFFANEDEGIILEDDCVPSASFFRFCETLLPQFRNDDRVFAIQGNFFGSVKPPDTSYLFSKNFYMWGWATWADRWNAVAMDDLDTAQVAQTIANDNWLDTNFLVRAYWLEILKRQAAGAIDSWGYSATFHCFGSKLFNVTPTKNLVLNIGVGESATRTADLDCGPYHRKAMEMDFPLVNCERYAGADELLPFENRWRIQISAWRLVRQILKNKMPRVYELARRIKHALSARSGANA